MFMYGMFCIIFYQLLLNNPCMERREGQEAIRSLDLSRNVFSKDNRSEYRFESHLKGLAAAQTP